jgi:hypothetical protein
MSVRTHMTDHVGVAFGDSTHAARRRKIRSDHADRHAARHPSQAAGRQWIGYGGIAVGEDRWLAGAFPDQV